MLELPENILETKGLRGLITQFDSPAKRRVLLLYAYGLNWQDCLDAELVKQPTAISWMKDPKFEMAKGQISGTRHNTDEKNSMKDEALNLYIGHFTIPIIQELFKVIFSAHKDKVDAIKFFLKDLSGIKASQQTTIKFESLIKQVLAEPDSRPAIEGEVKEIYAINQEGS